MFFFKFIFHNISTKAMSEEYNFILAFAIATTYGT